MSEVVLPYRPHRWQKQVHGRLQRFSVLVCHRRFGKTVLCVNQLIREALSTKRQDWRGAYIAPLFKQARAVAWDYLRQYAGPVPGIRFRETDRSAEFPNGARISLYGADNPDALRGIYLDSVVLDEVAQMPGRLWGEIIRPALADRQGRAVFIGTPQGRNQFLERWEYARRDPEWCAIMFKASETGLLPEGELEAARREMSAEQYAQEFECSFTAGVRGAYYARLIEEAETGDRILGVPYEPLLPVDTAWDLGMGDSTAIWFSQTSPGGEVRLIDYYEASGEGLAHYAKVLEARGYVYGRHVAPHDIRVRELGTGRSRLEIAGGLGIRFDIAPALAVEDGIEAVRALLPKCFFDSDRCAAGLDALRNYRRTGEGGPPSHDWTSHAADAFRYLAVTRRKSVGNSRPKAAESRYDMFG